MEIREVQPEYSRPQRLRLKWTSPSTGHSFYGPKDLEELEPAMLKRLGQEIQVELCELKAQLKAAWFKAEGRPKGSLAPETYRLRRRKAFLGALRHAITQEIKAAKVKAGESWAEHFVEACKAALPRDQYQRLASQASNRMRSAA